MKKTLRNILFLAAFTPFLMQCATQDEVQRLQYQLHVVNKKLADMQNSTVGDIQKRQAASSNQMDQLQEEIASLKGQLEETNMQNRLLQEQNDALQSNMGNIAKEEAQRREEALNKIAEEQRIKEARISELNEKLQAQQESLQAIQDARVREAERRAEEARAKADAAKAKALSVTSSSTSSSGIIRIASDQNKRVVADKAEAPQSVHVSQVKPITTAPVTQPVVVSPQKTVVKPAAAPEQAEAPESPPMPETTPSKPSSASGYAEAESLYQQKQYAKAYDGFEQIAMSNPTGDTGVNAGFMMGECLYAQKEYDKAILQYQKFISQNGSHATAPAASLKQGMAFEQLADTETAKMIYKKIVSVYSTSPEAKIAKEKLGSL